MNRIPKIGVWGAILFCLACSGQRNDIFKSVFKEVPASGEILDEQKQDFFDCCLWLHFKIDKGDLKKILRSGYQPQGFHSDRWSQGVPPGMKWWKPQQLGDSALYFEKGTDKGVEGIFTNASMTEVYYVNYIQ